MDSSGLECKSFNIVTELMVNKGSQWCWFLEDGGKEKKKKAFSSLK